MCSFPVCSTSDNFKQISVDASFNVTFPSFVPKKQESVFRKRHHRDYILRINLRLSLTSAVGTGNASDFLHERFLQILDQRTFLKERRKEGNILFNDTLNTFYLRLYGIRHMVKDHGDNQRGNPLRPHGLLFPISSMLTPMKGNDGEKIQSS